jgi:hypothetical protein
VSLDALAMPSEVDLHYDLTGTGWSECRVSIGDSRCDLTASYLSDALGDLAAAVEDVLRWPRSNFSWSVSLRSAGHYEPDLDWTYVIDVLFYR